MLDRRVGGRPNVIARGIAGAWHVPAGFAFLVRHPSLWPLAALPTLLALGCLVGGAFVAFYTLPWAERILLPGRGSVGETFSVLMQFALDVGVLGAGALVGLGLALLLSAPILDQLSQRVEQRVRGIVPTQEGGMRWEILQSLKSGSYFVLAAPFIYLLTLVPVVGTIAGALWGSWALAFQLTDVPLARRGLDFAARRQWHRRWRAETIGFGLAGLVFLIVPCAGLLVAPALTVGGTLMVLEFEEGMEVPESPADPPVEAGAALPAPPPVDL